ncbi:MAG: hypothetical protein D6729_05755 [Deltaproteobacteria bacterium]|nr:MAG: hypothetical protein D6729_05755 [Deltaproteobacteria bacterium]
MHIPVRLHHVASLLSFALLCLGATACDNEAPAPPFLDLLPKATAALEVAVEGTAEPGSTVAITRDPAFEGDAPGSVTADPYNGRFRFIVPLAAGVENTFSVTATDAADNTSDPATAQIQQVQAYPAVVRLDVAPPVVSADDGSVNVAVQLLPPTPEVSMEGQEVVVHVENYPGSIADLTLTADSGGFAQGVLEGFSMAGTAEITALANTAGPDGMQASATRTVKVLPGLPDSAEILLSADVAGRTVGPAAEITIPAGTAVEAQVSVQDAQGNLLPDPAVQLSTDAPGAQVVAGTRLVGLRQSGTYSVYLQAGGIPVTGEARVTVEPNPAAGIIVSISDNRVVDGERVRVQVLDAYGNPVDPAEVALSIDGVPIDQAAGVTWDGKDLSFAEAGLYTLSATYVQDAAVTDSVQILVEELVDTRPPEASIDAILFPTSSLVAPRGRIEVQITLTDDRALADAILIAQFGEIPACSANSGALYLNGQTAVTTSASVRVPRCAAPLDPVAFIVQVRDQAGNVGFSPLDRSLSIAAPPGFDITAGTPYDAVITGYADKIKRGDSPTDVAVDPSSDVAYVTLAQNNRVIVVFPDRTQDDLRDLNRQRIDFQQPEGIAADRFGNIFVGDTQAGNNGRIDRVDAVLTTTRGYIDQGEPPGRLGLDESGPLSLLCIPFRTIDEVQCWTDVDTPAPLNVLTIDNALQNQLNQPIAVAVSAPTLWVLEQDCTVKQTTLSYDTATPAVTALPLITVSPGQVLSGACTDIAALPSGDVAVADNGAGTVVRITPGGGISDIAQGLPDVMGLDFSGGALFVLDAQLQTLFKITGPF